MAGTNLIAMIWEARRSGHNLNLGWEKMSKGGWMGGLGSDCLEKNKLKRQKAVM